MTFGGSMVDLSQLPTGVVPSALLALQTTEAGSGTQLPGWGYLHDPSKRCTKQSQE